MCWVGMDFLFVGGYWIWFLASLFFAPSGKLLPSFFLRNEWRRSLCCGESVACGLFAKEW